MNRNLPFFDEQDNRIYIVKIQNTKNWNSINSKIQEKQQKTKKTTNNTMALSEPRRRVESPWNLPFYAWKIVCCQFKKNWGKEGNKKQLHLCFVWNIWKEREMKSKLRIFPSIFLVWEERWEKMAKWCEWWNPPLPLFFSHFPS